MINELEEIKALFDEFYLIEEPFHNEVKENENPIKINFEGGNKTGLVFVFEQSLSDVDKEMIHNLIHKAMKLTMEDVALVDLSTQADVTLSQMINVIKPKRVIMWGTPNKFSSDKSGAIKYELIHTNGIGVLVVDVVSAFHENISLKTQLWNSIQVLLKS